MNEPTVLFRARVPARRLHRAEKVLQKLGLKPSDALNMLLAQIELREELPFDVSAKPKTMLTAEEQADEWTEILGSY